MKRFMSREKRAVSPVIATILLVSITVVLAGMLFIWVTEILETEKTETPYLAAEVQANQEQYLIVINEVDGTILLNDVTIQIVGPGGTGKAVFSNLPDDANATHHLNESGIYANPFLIQHNNKDVAVGFSDAPPADGKLNQDDIIYLRRASSSGDFGVSSRDRVRLFHEPSKTVIYDEPMEEG